MSQVLQYGVPGREGLLCENPACKEYATNLVTFKGSADEHFACSEHLAGLLRGLSDVNGNVPVSRHTRLLVPGERNKEEPKDGQESQKA